MKPNFIDVKKNNKVALRNFTEPNDKHDVIKTLLVRMLRRKHKDNTMVPIYTEYDPLKPNEDYPDVWMRVKDDIYVYEIQSDMNKRWIQRIQEQYEEVNLIIINMNKISNNIDKMREQLEDFIY